MTSAGGPTTPSVEHAPVPPPHPGDPAYPVAYRGYPDEPVYEVARPDRITRFFDWISARSPRWLAPVAVLGCLGGAVGYTLYADPTRSAPDAESTCLLKLTTGLDCPGCGGTRAFWYLLHGDLPAAARHHVLFVFAVPFLVYLYVAWASKQLFGWRLPRLSVGPVTIGVFLAAWLTFSVLRNLPWEPFTWFYV
ncbi:DUF2752 domain-containing protein [Micromonospora sp. NPDC050397]|uniref:DUF2752 domain-containing protein n=1 Tax=Micromonospora sp. NPDC050397 TaxID=3364279 RepID=UPI00384AE1A9